MLDTMMKVSLTLVAIDKMSRVIRDAVSKSETEFDKAEKIKDKLKRKEKSKKKKKLEEPEDEEEIITFKEVLKV